jgi:hypothetical protein
MPPPTPCRMRAAMSDSTFQANPHSADAAVNVARARTNVRLVPKRSPIQPDAGIHIARLSR